MEEQDWADELASQLFSEVFHDTDQEIIAVALRSTRTAALEEAAVFVETHLIGYRRYAVKAIPGNYEKRGLLAEAIRALKEKSDG